jgi:hypothetical protein
MGSFYPGERPSSRGRDEQATEIAIATLFYNEADYLKEWIEFHLMVGVDRFYLYDNGSTDGFQSVLDHHVRRNQVVVVPWAPFLLKGNTQLLAFAHAACNCSPTVRWLAFVDIDEFLFSEISDTIQPILAKFEDFGGLKIPRFEFGPNGHKEKPEGLVIENYTRAATRGANSIANGKENSIAKVKMAVQPARTVSVMTHACIVDGDILKISDETPTDLRINHYFSKSESEFERKLQRGFSWHKHNKKPDTASARVDFLDAIQDNEGGHYLMSRFVEQLKSRL